MHRNMRATQWLVVLGSVALLGTACGSTIGSARSTTSATQPPSPFAALPFTQPGTTVAAVGRHHDDYLSVVPAPRLDPSRPETRNRHLATIGGHPANCVFGDIDGRTHPTTVRLALH